MCQQIAYDFVFYIIWGMPCIPILIRFSRSISCLCKSVTCKKQGRVRDWEISRKGCCMVFYTSENVLSAWQQINNPSIAKHNAIKTTEYGCKQNHISEKNLVQYLRWHFLYLFSPSLCCFRGQEVICILMCLQRKYTFTYSFFSPSASCK